MASDLALPHFRLRPPPLPTRVLPRPQVRNALLATEPGGTCVIAAATGYGATTAVAQALAGTADVVSWLSLDSTVDDEQAMRLFAAAIGAADADLGIVVPALAEGDSTWVIVDGLDPRIHRSLTASLSGLVGRLPATARMVVTAHQDLGWAQVTQLNEVLLEFDEDESLELLAMTAEHIHIDEASDIIGLSQGWACALVASAGLVRSQMTLDRLKATLAIQLLADWFENLDESSRRFMEQTAILDLLGEGPAGRITGRADVGELLDELARRHSFVRPCPAPEGHAGRWWRRHPLLTALLRERTSGHDVLGAHQAAASWFGETSDVYSTMQHMLAAGRFDGAASYLNDHEVQLLSTGQADQVLQWYGQLADARAHQIDALVRSAWAMVLARDIVGADAVYARLHAALTAQRATADATVHDEQLLSAWAGEEALLQAYLAAYKGDPGTVVAAARRAMEAPGLERLADLAQLAPILVVRGLLWAGRSAEAKAFLDRVATDAGVNPVMRELHLAGARALCACAQGRIIEAQTLVTSIHKWSQASGIDARAVQIYAPTLALAWVQAELGNLDEAQALAGSLLDEAGERGHLSDATWAALILSKAQVARGDYGAALRSVTRARELAVARTPGSELLVPVNQQHALIHMATGDFIRADRIIRQLPPSGTRVLLASRAGIQQQPARARRMLEALAGQDPRVVAERHLLMAAVQLPTSRRLAQGHLRQASAVARDNGQRLLLSPPVPGILELAAETALEFDDEPLRWLLSPLPASQIMVEGRATKLSRGELQLLLLLPTRAKNVDIADQLGVSVNTVKTRLRRLYAKLGVGSRDEAIVKARSRGLLGSE